MSKFLLPALASAALLASGAAAQNAPGRSKPASAADPNKMRCVVLRETGSHLSGKRVCKTLAQWEEERQNERDQLESSRRDRSSHNGGL